MRTWDIGPPEIVGSWNALPGPTRFEITTVNVIDWVMWI